MGSSLSRASVIWVNGQTVELYCGIALPSGKILSSARRAWISAFLQLDPSTKNRRRRIAGAEVEAASKLTNREEARTSKNHLSDFAALCFGDRGRRGSLQWWRWRYAQFAAEKTN